MKVNSEQALDIVSRVIERANDRGQAIPPFVVLVGGTALSVYAIRGQSEDVDFYTPEAMDDAALEIENELKPTYGDTFKIDVTVGENLWGDIILRDIANSPEWLSIDIGNTHVSIRILSIQDLLILKLAAGRTKDLSDLPLIAPRVSADEVLARFNQLIKWHGNSNAKLGFANSFVIMMKDLYDMPEQDVIEKMDVPDYIKVILKESYCECGDGHGYKK